MEDVKLLQLENDFNRTAALVYANGTSLRDCYEEFLKEIISLNTEDCNNEENDRSTSGDESIVRTRKRPHKNKQVPLIQDDDSDKLTFTDHSVSPVQQLSRHTEDVSIPSKSSKAVDSRAKELNTLSARPFSINLTPIQIESYQKLHERSLEIDKEKSTLNSEVKVNMRKESVVLKDKGDVNKVTKDLEERTRVDDLKSDSNGDLLSKSFKAKNAKSKCTDSKSNFSKKSKGKSVSGSVGIVPIVQEADKPNTMRPSICSKNSPRKSKKNVLSTNADTPKVCVSLIDLQRKTLLRSQNISSLLHDTFADEDMSKERLSSSKLKIQMNSRSFVAPKLKVSKQVRAM